jgi:Oxygenase, catalysing oxidative methylation of damaged DNA
VIALNARAAKPAADAGLQERVRWPMGFPFSRRVSLIHGLRVNLIFAVRDPPAQGARGTRGVVMRHGSRLRTGQRFTLGINFHDAA